ncbi:MAG: hypothetical protein NW215_05780 [Hyphomicrobiales bacterium]|nr:hypothetical protein [Hyphomicrobiales bacterium]
MGHATPLAAAPDAVAPKIGVFAEKFKPRGRTCLKMRPERNLKMTRSFRKKSFLVCFK